MTDKKPKNIPKLWERISNYWLNGNRAAVVTEVLILSKRDLRRLMVASIDAEDSTVIREIFNFIEGLEA